MRTPRRTPGLPATPGEREPDQAFVPDVRDGLTRVERIVLWKLRELELERPGRAIPSAQLYGRVAEHVNLTPEQLQTLLARLGARGRS